MIVRDRTFDAYQLLGVPRTAGPEVIDAAFRSQVHRMGDRDSDRERIRKVEAAYELLKDPRRRRDYDAAIGIAAMAIVGPAEWQVKPRSAPSAPAGGTTEAAPAPRPAIPRPRLRTRRGTVVAPVESSVSDGTELAAVSAPVHPAAPKHPSVPAPVIDYPLVSHAEPPPPTELGTADAPPRRNWSRIGIPLAGGLAVVAAALSAPLLIDRAPETSGTGAGREAPVPTPPPDAKPTSGSPDRSGAAEAPASVAKPAGRPSADQGHRESPPASATVQEPAEASHLAAARSTDSASPTTSLAAISTRAASATPAAGASPAATPAVIPDQQSRQIVPMQPAGPAPARWISGGLRNSDNRNGRFQGFVAVRLTVQADGRIGGCRVIRSSGNPALNATTCGLLWQRMQFNPARDAAGRPVQSEVSTSYTWSRRARR